MRLDDYQILARQYAQYPGASTFTNPYYPVLGLTGEAGEVANKVKKMQRDNLDIEDLQDDIGAELGDVLWYLAAIATEFDLSLTEIAEANLDKLKDRKARNVIGGSGDNR